MSLRNHPDKAWTAQLIKGLREGVRIGVLPGAPVTSATANLQSAKENPSVVDRYLVDEWSSKNIAGPFNPDQLKGLVHNRFGVIPKPHKPGKWRLIVDLSHPKGRSINDHISEADSSMEYSSVNDAARIITHLGRHTQMAKIDIASAFRIIPVHPQDCPLLAMRWKDKVYMDTQLPFGLRSAPTLFNAYADALEWILQQEGCNHLIPYLDDSLLLGPPHSPTCQQGLEHMLATCHRLGVPLASDKIEGPTTRLSFLGIELDSDAMEARLPQDKLHRLSSEITAWQDKKACRHGELEHLLGLLHFTCTAVAHGRPSSEG